MNDLILHLRLFKCLLMTIVLVISMSFLVNLHAESPPSDSSMYLPEYYPVYFDHAGLVTEVDKKNHQLIFGLVHIPYDSNVQVSTLASKFGTVDSLQVGDEIGYETTRGNGQSRIIRIWLLPSGTVATP